MSVVVHIDQFRVPDAADNVQNTLRLGAGLVFHFGI